MFTRDYEGLLAEVSNRFGVTEEVLVQWEMEAKAADHAAAAAKVAHLKLELEAAEAELAEKVPTEQSEAPAEEVVAQA